MSVESSGIRGRGSRAVRLGCAICGVLGISGLVLWLLGRSLRGSSWLIDVAVGGSTPLVVVLIVMTLLGVWVLRRWVGVLALGLVVASVLVVTHGRTLVAPGGSPGDPTSVRVLVQNVGMENPDPGGVLASLGRADADIVVLVEPVWAVYADLTKRGAVPAYPHRAWRARDDGALASPIVVLSRWGLTTLEGVDERLGLALRVERPEGSGGPLSLLAVHPASPRDADRWAHGNGVIRSLCAAFGQTGHTGPVLVAGDLNGGPGSVRDATLGRKLGVRRAQPLLALGASYPSKSWPLGVSIDDVWHSGGTRVRGWSLVEIPGSDHLGVEVELVTQR